MCGITGIINFNKLSKENIKIAQSASKLQKHRGPDHTGQFISKKVFLINNRLRIIGLKKGNQPIFSRKKDIILVANGEIYNYLEIKKYLKSKNYTFDTDTDVEVIIKLYEYSGIKGFSRLRGMFSFCLYDQKKQIVYIFRDRLGEKPLYYKKEKNFIFFNSEFRSIIGSLNSSFEADCDSINDYLFHGYIVEPKTFVKGIYKLEAGSYLKIDLLKKKIKKIKYWNLKNLKNDKNINFKKIIEDIGKVLPRADVNIAVANSSGIDSTSLAILLRKKKNKFKSISLNHLGANSSEAKLAKKQMKKYKINTKLVNLSDEEMLRNFTKTVVALDEPIADVASSSYYKLMDYTNKMKKKVLIFGHGVDELFWGYDDVIENLNISNILISKKNNFLKFISIFLILIPKDYSWKEWIKWILKIFKIPYLIKLLKLYKTKKILPYLDNNRHSEYYENKIVNILTNKFNKNLKFFHPNEFLFSEHKINKKNIDTIFCYLLMKTYLRENGLMQLDKLSMSRSVEARVPYVDYRLVEEVFKYRLLNKDYLKPKKYLFKKIIKENLNFTNDNKKKGFDVPRRWSNILYKRFLPMIKNDSYINRLGIFDDQKLLKLITNISFKRNYFHRILVLEIWLKNIFKNKKIFIND